MLTPFQQAVEHCLTNLDQYAQDAYPWPGPTLLAALRETPVPANPDPTARFLGVVAVPVPPTDWQHPDGPAGALRLVAADLHHPLFHAQLAGAVGGIRIVAWVFMRAEAITKGHGTGQRRCIDAVDLNGAAYAVTRQRDHSNGLVAVDDTPDIGSSEILTVLHSLARMAHPGN
ncbi:hypothetical protein ACGFIE_00505 [Micromonospora sp. NPDC049275]|uniref:hypothetical protein n=1 Tax=Micromonospora sp. NPDC049275 TaxID=3364268 RepID=UPI00371E46D9